MGKGHSVLDVGTGSGILAIAAAKLGAQEVRGVDIDEVAVEGARGEYRKKRRLRNRQSQEGECQKGSGKV